VCVYQHAHATVCEPWVCRAWVLTRLCVCVCVCVRGCTRSAATVASTTYSLIYSLHVDAVGKLLVRYPSVRATIEGIAKKREQETASMTTRIKAPRAEPEPESVVCYAGSAARSAAEHDRRSELRQWLETIFLERYMESLVAQGYDSLACVSMR
jgi:hypothetical protein